MPNREPVRVLDGPHQPYEPFWTVKNAAETKSGEAEIEFYGPISEFSWWGDEVTPAKFRDDLNKLGGGPVTVRINSSGGEVFAASVIRSIIMDYPGRVTTRIDGLCASSATFVAMAGDVVRMQDSAFFMIHDPWTIAIGGEEEMKSAAAMLKTVRDGIIDAYRSKANLSADQLAKMMHKETWMTAQEAKEYGFIDEVISETSKKLDAANFAGIMNALRNYQHVPAALLERLQPETAAATVAAEAEPPDVARLRAEVKILV